MYNKHNDPCGRGHLNHPRRIGVIEYSSENINELLRLIPRKANLEDVPIPDEEDLSNETGFLKLKDKKHNRYNYSGLGRCYLRKNMVDGVNVLTQDMFTNADGSSKKNTRYIIQYDYDLNGATIEVPEGCVLDFEGGGITGGKIVFNNTDIHGLAKINTEIEGTIANENLDIRWFGAVGDGIFDNSDIIQKIIDFTEGYNDRVYVYIPDGVWGIGKTLKFRNYCGNIKGNNPFTSVIKAINQMDWMFTSKDGAEYSNPIITNVCLDGGMEGDFYKGEVFNENVTIKAKGGISFPRYWYTYFNTVRLRNIAGIAFHVNEIWNVNLENIYIQNCHIGMRLGMTNGVCISNCEFNTLSRYGIFTAVNYTIDIRNNIFEIIGKSAIFGYAPSVGQILINSNYFELCSIDGVEMFNYDGTLSYGQIHTNVIITGRNSGTTSPVKNGGTGYPCIVIKGNSLQEPNSYEKCCAFYVCNCSTLDIESNIISHEGWDLFGFILNTGVRITNVSVKNNSILKLTSDGFGQTPIQWCSLNCYHRDGYGLIMDVLTDSNKPHRDENMMKYLMFYAYGRAVFRATGSKYNGYTIYTCDEFITLLTRRKIDNIDVTDGTLDDALALYTYYTSTDGVTWTKNVKLFGSLDQNIELKAGTYFTVPVVQYLDRSKIDNNEYEVNIPNYDLFRTINIEYKTGTVINFTKDSNHSKCIWIGKNKFRLFNSNGIEAFNLSIYKLDGASVGCQIFDTNTKKPVWWDGSKWIDAAGEEV